MKNRIVILVVSVLVFGLLAFNLDVDTSLMHLLGDAEDAVPEEQASKVVAVIETDADEEVRADLLIEAAEAFAERVPETTLQIDALSAYEREVEFCGKYYWLLADSAQRARVYGVMSSPDSIKEYLALLKRNLGGLQAPLFEMTAPYSPFGFLETMLADGRRAQQTPGAADLLYDDYVIDREAGRLFAFVNTETTFGNSASSMAVVAELEKAAREVEKQVEGVTVTLTGAPVISSLNTSRVQKDQLLTLTLTMVLMVILVVLCYRGKRTALLIIVPVLYGTLFAVAVIAALGIRISMLSMGAASAVMGIAFAYSIHMVTHHIHVGNREVLVKEMTPTMLVGSITTIGAFLGLLFTQNVVLRNLGLFASLMLLGTLFFTLYFLPQFLKQQQPKPAMTFIANVAGRDYSHSWVLIAALAALTAVCGWFAPDVRYNASLASLSYNGDERQQRALEAVGMLLPDSGLTVQVSALTLDSLADMAEEVFGETKLSRTAVRQRNNGELTKADAEVYAGNLSRLAEEEGFRDDAFAPFIESLMDWAETSVDMVERYKADCVANCEGLHERNGGYVLQRKVSNVGYEEVADYIARHPYVKVTDIGFTTWRNQQLLIDDFNKVLYVSSAIVFIVLLLSYRNITDTLLVFMPMCVAWVIILGLMALFDIEFNIVNIILSTFIFGVGDDFAIFVMDGLKAGYSKGNAQLLVQHKTAIAISTLALVIGMGTQAFALHPAIRGVGMLSLFGLLAVILTAFVVQPFLFRICYSKPFRTFFRTVFFYGLFAMGCVAINVLLLVVIILPVRHSVKQDMVSALMHNFMKAFYSIIERRYVGYREGEADFTEPRVVVANHSSFVDVIAMYSMVPKAVFVTKGWVMRNPLFGLLAKYCGFYNVDSAHCNDTYMCPALMRYAERGYSIIIFPEGTRSSDGTFGKFHSGCLHLARNLGLQILPIVMYGNHIAASKNNPLVLQKTNIMNAVLPLQPNTISIKQLKALMLGKWQELEQRAKE